MKSILKIFTLVLVISLFTSCEDDNVAIETNTIADIAVNTPNLSILVDALVKTDLVSTLKSNGSFTVLAPSNNAFTTFLSANGYTTINDVPTNTLREILLNHVIDGSLKSTDLSTGYRTTLATSVASNSPMSIYINASNGVSFNGISNVSLADIDADNGTIHVVDAVIGLPDVVTFATADANFSILVEALTRENSFNFVSTLSTNAGTDPAPFTVFAPTNNAFVDLLAELQVQSLSDISTATLESTLNTHVVAGANIRDTSLSNGMPVATLGGTLTIDTTGSMPALIDAQNRKSIIIVTNVQANNGVVHAINKVVLE